MASPTLRRGVEGGDGILEHHLDGRVHSAVRASFEEDLAGGGSQQSDEHPAEGGLAAAALADDAERLTAPYGHGDVVHGRDGLFPAPELAAQSTRLQHDVPPPGALRPAGGGRGAGGVHARDGAQQPPRVRFARCAQHPGDRAFFDDAPAAHDEHVVHALGGDADVVGDQQQAHAGLRAQGVQQVQDLGLHGHVEGGGRLVGDQQFGSAGEGHGDQGPLAHAAAELVRPGPGTPYRVGDAHAVQHLHGTRACGAPGHARVDAVHLGDLVADGVVRVEGRQRVLEDHGGLGAAQPPQFLLRGALYVHAGHPDRARHPRPGAPVQAEQGGGGGGLAGAGLSDEGESGAGGEPERHVVHGPHVAELDAEPGDFHEAPGVGEVP
ncbi:hypothetical protein GCM10020256_24950 [Streptomyces thermocoprophilus]